jgi:hypothetical protein
LGLEYNDATNFAVAVRTAQGYDLRNDKMPFEDVDHVRADGFRTWPEGWLMSGAIREDDSGYFTGLFSSHVLANEPEPHDDPWGNFNRFCNHFFDPVNNNAYSGACPPLILQSAPAWALGVTGDPFASPPPATANSSRRNHFTIRDARENMWLALTGYWRDFPDQRDERERTRAWATVFRSLGDVLHLNQDMAQPQHTRDEGHGMGHAAWYEKYIEGRAKRLKEVSYSYRFTTLEAKDLRPLTFGEYPTPRFPSYAAYWSTGLGAASANGQGLADYSNRGFFTPGENLGSGKYASPTSERTAYTQTIATAPDGTVGLYFDSAVRDTVLNADSRPIHMTRSSLLDQKLIEVAREMTPPPLDPEVFSIDRAVFDDRAELLVPRAIAYSAGLIDHFFRGRLRISAPDDGVYALVDHAVESDAQTGGFSTIKAKVANATAGEQMTGGSLVAIVKFRRDACYAPDLSTLPDSFEQALQCRGANEEMMTADFINLSGELTTPNVDREFTFRFPKPIPINAIDLRLQVAYRGTLGEETDAVAVAAKDLSEPTYLTYFNATDYARIGAHVYTRAEINATPALLASVVPQSCVDYALSPPQLRPTCFQPVNISATFGVGSTPKTIDVAGLPPRRFSRIAMLAEGTSTNVDQLASTCSGARPFTFNNYRLQLDINPYTGAQTLYYGTNMTVRGIKTWFPVVCVFSADGNLANTPDDRLTRIDAIADKTPFAVSISPL